MTQFIQQSSSAQFPGWTGKVEAQARLAYKGSLSLSSFNPLLPKQSQEKTYCKDQRVSAGGTSVPGHLKDDAPGQLENEAARKSGAEPVGSPLCGLLGTASKKVRRRRRGKDWMTVHFQARCPTSLFALPKLVFPCG